MKYTYVKGTASCRMGVSANNQKMVFFGFYPEHASVQNAGCSVFYHLCFFMQHQHMLLWQPNIKVFRRGRNDSLGVSCISLE